MKIGIKIRRLRDNKRLSQEELAERVGVSQVTIGKWEQGTSIKHEYIKKLASSLEVSVDYLLEEKQTDLNPSITNDIESIEIAIKATKKAVENLTVKMNKLIELLECKKN